MQSETIKRMLRPCSEDAVEAANRQTVTPAVPTGM